jgi:IMP dehydrogenase
MALTFDDVLLVPRHSHIESRGDVQPNTTLVEGISLSIPILSANMDTVTESAMAIAMARAGGIGVLHRFMGVERQAREVAQVKRTESYIVEEPATVSPDTELADARALMEEAGIGGLVVVDSEGHVVGMLTRRDLLLAPEEQMKVEALMTPRSELVVVRSDIELDNARSQLHAHRLEKLPMLEEDDTLRGLITAQDIVKTIRYPGATKDEKGRLRVGAAVGAREQDAVRARACLEAGADLLVVDIAHGHSVNCTRMVRRLKREHPDIPLIAGNVGTAEGIRDLARAGADAVKVGVGPGSICTTRVVTGFGVPQLTAIMQCAEGARELGVPLIADGGIRHSGDLVKALAAGANSVMIGGLLAGTEEAPGATVIRDGRKVKIVRGMASLTANVERRMVERGADLEAGEWEQLVPEGVEAVVHYRGAVEDTLHQLVGGLRSGMSYAGAKTIEELWERAVFMRVSPAAQRESGYHDVMPLF